MKKNFLVVLNICLFGMMMLNVAMAQVKMPKNAKAPNSINNNATLSALASFELAVKGQTYIYHNEKAEGAYQVTFSADGSKATISLGAGSCQNSSSPCDLGTATVTQDGNEIKASISKNRVNYVFTFAVSGDNNKYLGVNYKISTSDTNKTGLNVLNKKN